MIKPSAIENVTSATLTMVQQVKQIVGDRWVDWCLTLIFDRGGFCAKLFKTLDDLKVHSFDRAQDRLCSGQASPEAEKHTSGEGVRG